MNIRPLLDRVVLKATEVEETTQSGFILTTASHGCNRKTTVLLHAYSVVIQNF